MVKKIKVPEFMLHMSSALIPLDTGNIHAKFRVNRRIFRGRLKC